MIVILEREPHAPNKRFRDEPRAHAMRRAQLLADLHGCKFTASEDATTVTVHASDWYKPLERRAK